MRDEPGWAEQRREAAAEHERMLERRRSGEHERARGLLRRFAAAAAAAGLPAQPLRVQGYGGRGSARTDRTGWYLRADRTAAVGTDGEFYLLTARLGWRDRARGVALAPSEPPAVLGAGGRDGDSIALADALERLLPGWQQPGGRAAEG
ncbi:hypothetical protein MF406_13490 [Georgenia sp. TF02-10]|uniref:hypothetical protein n=1 Tax=Georgenia sp. TF02-10 TaxID=2917725 RepID=UPI001FA7E479|nr:hypothetical protein [Georgenia sp. TF02-10]UNX56427.1 hypothetical protein MF406_13490 [Georgenia sp. TF02-10]